MIVQCLFSGECFLHSLNPFVRPEPKLRMKRIALWTEKKKGGIRETGNGIGATLSDCLHFASEYQVEDFPSGVS